ASRGVGAPQATEPGCGAAPHVKMSRILVVEDEQHLADGLRFNLEAEQHDVDLVDNGQDALERLTAEPNRQDLEILDLMLACRHESPRPRRLVPGLMLRARGRSEDVLRGLGAGADDYLPKPFELPILLSRVRGLLRRHAWFRLEVAAQTSSVASHFSFRDKNVDFEQLEIRIGEKRMPLTLMEAALLRYLVQHQGRPVPRKEILERVWGVRDDTDTRAIDNFIVRLRRYIEDNPASPRHLRTIRGVGYRFVADPD